MSSEKSVRSALEDLGVWQPEQREDLAENLSKPSANYRERRYVVGFLMGALGLHFNTALDFVDEHNNWTNYKAHHTRYYAYRVAKDSYRIEPKLYKDVPDTGYLETPSEWGSQGDAGHQGKRENSSQSEKRMGWYTDYRDGCPYNLRQCKGALRCQDQRLVKFEGLAHYRSVGGEDHTNATLDIELPPEERKSLSRETQRAQMWEIGKTLWAACDLDRMIFTGGKGFHLRRRLPRRLSADELKKWARDCANKASVEPKYIDDQVLNPKQVYRLPGCRHPETGFYCIEVTPEMGLEEIIDRAEEGPAEGPLLDRDKSIENPRRSYRRGRRPTD